MIASQTSRDAVLAAARRACASGSRPTMDELAAAAGVSRATLFRVFGSREAVFEAIGVELPPPRRDQILAAAAELLAEQGLARLSMDELADHAGASRATLYRLFPGKPALFRELMRAYSPMAGIVETLEDMIDRPPAEVMPALAGIIARSSQPRLGLLRSLFFEVTGGSADADEAVATYLGPGARAVAAYVSEQMTAGRLRPMHPLLAVQAFVGPIVFHLLTRSLAEDQLGLELSLDESVNELADTWLRAMTSPIALVEP
ncbi:MAG: TetR/AcrR family transcriptional regulator [Egibacteraceae bacterium]